MTEAADPADLGLMARWNRLLPGSPELGARLLAAYGEPTRHYHDHRHLRAVLDTIDALAGEATDPALVELGAWFHDAVYAVQRNDNEERSAQLVEATLPGAGLSFEEVAEVARLVRLTANHDPTAADRNGAVLCDADLAILASDPESYDAYVRAVRQEYAHVSDDDWRAGRAAVLEQLLDLPALFHTAAGTSWEAAARTRLRTELALLSSRGS